MEKAVRSEKNLRYYWNRFREEQRRRGLGGLSMLILTLLARKSLRTNKATWYRLDLNEFVTVSPGTGALSDGFMDLNEAQDFFRKHHDSFPWMFLEEEMEAARDAGHVFPCLREGDEVIGYVKLGIKKAFVLDFERILHIPPTAAFIYDSFIMPSHRGNGLGSLIIERTAEFAQKNGFCELWCHIPAVNVPSKRMVERVGFKAAGEVRFVKLFGKDFFRKQPRSFPLSTERSGRNSTKLILNEVPVQ